MQNMYCFTKNISYKNEVNTKKDIIEHLDNYILY